MKGKPLKTRGKTAQMPVMSRISYSGADTGSIPVSPTQRSAETRGSYTHQKPSGNNSGNSVRNFRTLSVALALGLFLTGCAGVENSTPHTVSPHTKQLLVEAEWGECVSQIEPGYVSVDGRANAKLQAEYDCTQIYPGGQK